MSDPRLAGPQGRAHAPSGASPRERRNAADAMALERLGGQFEVDRLGRLALRKASAVQALSSGAALGEVVQRLNAILAALKDAEHMES